MAWPGRATSFFFSQSSGSTLGDYRRWEDQKELSKDEKHQDDENLLQAVCGGDRKKILFSATVHAARNVDDAIQVHLALKFEYDLALIVDVFKKRSPSEDELLPKQGVLFSLVPYMILNALDIQQFSWSAKTFNVEDTTEGIEERIELSVLLTGISYSRYFPMELNVLLLKVGMDGSGDSHLVNLTPKYEKAKSSCRCGLFRKKTSKLKVQADDDVVCRMFARDARNPQERDQQLPVRPETTLVTAIFFEGDTYENTMKYVGVSTIMMALATFLPVMEVGDIVQTGLAMVLADVGLLYVLPPNDDFTTTEQIIVCQIWLLLVFTCIVSYLKIQDGFFENGDYHIISFVIAVLCIMLLTAFKYILDMHKFGSLKDEIKRHLSAKRDNVGLFRNIENDF